LDGICVKPGLFRIFCGLLQESPVPRSFRRRCVADLRCDNYIGVNLHNAVSPLRNPVVTMRLPFTVTWNDFTVSHLFSGPTM
jgi:hypothetical protein